MATELETEIAVPPMRVGEPAWIVATFYPPQGEWSEEDYFRLETKRFVELSNGCVEVLPMPSPLHQAISAWLFEQLLIWCRNSKIGKVFYSPLPLKLFPGTVREPDLLIVPVPQAPQAHPYFESALFVLEIVSGGAEARKRDHIDKRADYARAGIPEYWIVDPFEKTITVLQLENDDYVQFGRFEARETANSPTLAGFSIACEQMWTEARKYEVSAE